MHASVLILTVLTLLPSFYGQKRTFVDSRTKVENDIDECIFGGPEHPCHTLEYAADQLSELATIGSTASIFIHIISPTVPLNDTIRFRNVNSVWISGQEDTQVVCGITEAGLEFSSVHGIHIANLTFKGCGAETFTAAIHMSDCMNVTIQNITIASSGGVALAFIDTYGDIQIVDTWFINNSMHWEKEQWHIGAVYVEFNHCPTDKTLEYYNHSSYNFSNCIFFMNAFRLQYHQANSLGGGLALIFRGVSCFNNVTLIKCKFQKNNGTWGGGLYVHFANQAHNNSVMILGNMFKDNKATKAGGGVAVVFNNSVSSPFRNNVFFQRTRFTGNTALYGGGTAVSASHSKIPSKPGDTIVFDKCSWKKNSAYFSSSVDLSPVIHDTLSTGFLPVPVFIDCYFSDNNLQTKTVEKRTKYTNHGSFTVTKFTVQFGYRVVFKNHNSALHAISGIIEFQPGTQALFYKNRGINGGAIALYGFSSLHVQDGCYLNFSKNTALEVGGAIYHHSFDQHDFVSTHACFIQYIGSTIQDACKNVPNVTFEFKGNKAYNGGNSIYALSFYPCFFELFSKSKDKHEILDGFLCRAHFQFDKPLENATATSGVRFSSNGSQLFHVIPGQKYHIPLSITDEMKNEVPAVYRMKPKKLKVEHMHTVTGDVRLYGKPNQEESIQFSVIGLRELSFQIQISLVECPPGFFLSKGENSQCKCSALFQEYAYPGIEKCNFPEFQAYIVQGYWAGYLGYETPESLYTAPCPLGFCSYEHNFTKLQLLLPGKASNANLSEFMCGKYRKGILCGECREGRTVYYHSHHYKCGESNFCQFGLLFYFLSELIPLTILFTVVIVFDIHFTSGTINGFIFFSQVLDSLSVDAKGIIHLPSPIDKLNIGYKIIYGLFNFDFFSIESLSFCLWKRATVLDTLAFKYITTVFAFGLVMCLVCIIKRCQCRKVCVLKKKFSARDSVIHGLSAFLVMCYAQCTKVSFQILTSVTLTGKGGAPGLQVSGFGGIPYFRGKHLAYAIPASICLTTIVAIPPMLLITFPLVLQLLALCRLSESRAANWVALRVWTVRLKPVLDSFQACFKDRLRFFAGLYFAYRVIILAVYAFSKTTVYYYITVEAVLILILGFHSLAQPYEIQQHNIVDSLIFIDLALINGFTLFSYVHHSHSWGKKTMDAVLWLQMILIYLPIVCLSSFIVVKTMKKRNEWKARAAMQLLQEEVELLQLNSLIDHERLPYQEFEPSALQHSVNAEQDSL